MRLVLDLTKDEIDVTLDALATVAGLLEHRLGDVGGAIDLWSVINKLRRAIGEAT